MATSTTNPKPKKTKTPPSPRVAEAQLQARITRALEASKLPLDAQSRVLTHMLAQCSTTAPAPTT